MSKPKVQKIRIKGNNLFGWLDGKNTAIYWDYAGTLYGQSLYRLAKAIVRRFEDSNAKTTKKKTKKTWHQCEFDFR